MNQLKTGTCLSFLLAKRSSVSLSFIQDLLKRDPDSSTIAPRAHGGGATAKLNQEQVALVERLVEEDNAAIFVDEVGVTLAMSRYYARSLQGTRAYEDRHLDKTVTMIGGASL